MKILDTNILLDYPNILEKKELNPIISIQVIKELGKLKNDENETKAKKARRAIKKILSCYDSIIFNSDEYENMTTDEVLISLAFICNATLVTNDNDMTILAKMKNVICENYSEEIIPYQGVLKLYIGKDDEAISSLYQNESELPLFENEYVEIIEEDEIKDILRYSNNKFVTIFPRIIKSDYFQDLEPRNPEQICYFDMLYNSKSTINLINGPFGAGKSFLLTSYAVQELEKGNINKIVWVPNNSQVDNTREIGLMPGDNFQKEMIYMGTLIDIIGTQEVERLYSCGQLEIIPMGAIRGRNLEDSIVIVNEAQNLTGDHVKLLIGRCAKNTRIFFDGDLKQADKRVFREKNGLRLLRKLRHSEKYSDIFSMVTLEKTERSKTAEAAGYLEEVE